MNQVTSAPLGLLVRLLDIRLSRMSAERLSRVNVSLAEMSVLRVLSDRPGLRSGAVAEALMIKPPNLSKLVNRLEEGGFIRREVSRADERAVALDLTSKGKRAVAFGREVSDEVEELALRDLTSADREALLVQLAAALNALQRSEEAGLEIKPLQKGTVPQGT